MIRQTGSRPRRLLPVHSLRGYIAVCFASTVVLFAAVAGVSLTTVRARDASRSELSTRLRPAQAAVGELAQRLLDQEPGVRGFDLTGQTSSRQPHANAIASQTSLLRELRTELATSPHALAALRQAAAAIAGWNTRSVEPANARRLFDTALNRLAALDREVTAAIATQSARGNAAGNHLVWIVGIVLGLLMLLSMGLYLLLRRQITKPLEILGARVAAAGSGNLEEPIPQVGASELSTLATAVDQMRCRLLEQASDTLQRSLIIAQDEERRRIAQDIHDDSVQSLTVVSLRLQRLGRRLPEPEQNMVRDAEIATTHAIARLRRLMFELHPVGLERDGLAAALRAYFTETIDPARVEWNVHASLKKEPSRSVQSLAYRLTREAVLNALKHANPTRRARRTRRTERRSRSGHHRQRERLRARHDQRVARAHGTVVNHGDGHGRRRLVEGAQPSAYGHDRAVLASRSEFRGRRTEQHRCVIHVGQLCTPWLIPSAELPNKPDEAHTGAFGRSDPPASFWKEPATRASQREASPARYSASGRVTFPTPEPAPNATVEGRPVSIDEQSLVLLGETRPRRLAFDANVTSAASRLTRLPPDDGMQEFVGSAEDAFVAWDARGSITEWTPQAEALFGWSRDEAIGNSFATLVVAPRHRIVHVLRTERFLHEGDLPLLGKWFELAGLHRDTREMTIEMTVWIDTHQADRTFNAFIRDPTQRSDVEEAFRDRARLQTVLDGVNDVIFMTDLAGVIVFASPSVRTALGYEPAELDGHLVEELVHLEDQMSFARMLRNAIATGSEIVRAQRVCTSDGRHVWMEATTTAVRDAASGDVVGLEIVSHDITSLKMVDAVRRRATGDLMRMIMDLRTAVGRERATVGELRDLDRNRNDLVAIASQELRTPLTKISAYSELLADPEVGPLSNCQRYLLEVVDRNVNTLLTMVENLVTIGGIEAGAFEVEMRPLEVLPIVHAAVEAMLPSAREQCIELTLDLANDTGLALGDAPQLDRLLLNLLSNAVKFNFDGGNVTVSSRRLDSDVEIVVADTGMGIPIEEQDKLFAPFFRSTMAQERAVPGSGLGLVVVKNIIDRHRGGIEIRSAPGAGTTVCLTLPAAHTSAAKTSVPASTTDT